MPRAILTIRKELHGFLFFSLRTQTYFRLSLISAENNVCELEPRERFPWRQRSKTNHISPCISEEVAHRDRAWSSRKRVLKNWRVEFSGLIASISIKRKPCDLFLNWKAMFLWIFSWSWKVCCISSFAHCVFLCGSPVWIQLVRITVLVVSPLFNLMKVE